MNDNTPSIDFEVAEVWHQFHIRAAMLLQPRIGVIIFSLQDSLIFPQIKDAAASALFVELISILDRATELILGSDEYEKCGRLRRRLEKLAKLENLSNQDELYKLVELRNEISHTPVGIDVAEVSHMTPELFYEASNQVGTQLVTWDLIRAIDTYDWQCERTELRECANPEYRWERDLILRILRNGVETAEIKQTQMLGGINTG